MLNNFKHKILFAFTCFFLLTGLNGFSQISFSAIPDCDDNTGTTATFSGMYVHINAISGTDGVNDITFSATNASNAVLSVTESGSGIGAANINGTLSITGLTITDFGTDITITIENNGLTNTIEVPVAICGFNVDTGGNGNTEDDISNGTFCSSQNGTTAPGILAQVLPNSDLSSNNNITSSYIYVLVDNTDANMIEASNTTGLFDGNNGVENLHDYTMYAFYVSDSESTIFNAALSSLTTIDTGDDILTNMGTFAGICYSFCCQNTFSPDCCEAEAGDITTNSIAECIGSSNLVFTPSLGNDDNGNAPNTDASYNYVYLVIEGGTIQEISTSNFDFSTYMGAAPITYTIYGLNYQAANINNFTNVSGGNISELIGTSFAELQADVSLTPTSTQVCAELTDADFTVTIFEAPIANNMTAMMCFGGSIEIDGQVMQGSGTFTHNWSIVSGTNTTATGITLSNETTAIVTLNSDESGSAGTVELMYIASDGNGCPTMSTVIVTIDPCNIGTGDDVMLDDPCVCLNNATTDENGQFSEVASIFSFAAGQNWYIQSVTSYNTSTTLPNGGLFDVNSSAPPTIATPLTAGTPFIDASTDGIDNDNMNGIDDAGEAGLYYINAVHYDGLGFVLTIANDDLGITRTITNRGCFYPNPTVTIDATLCSSSLPFDLSAVGSAVNGSDNSTAANLDANGDPFYTNGSAFFSNTIAGNYPAGGTFDLYDSNGTLVAGNITSIPSNLPSSGSYTLTYTYNQEDIPIVSQPSGTNIDVGPFDRGCVQTTSVDITINLVDCNSFPWNGQD